MSSTKIDGIMINYPDDMAEHDMLQYMIDTVTEWDIQTDKPLGYVTMRANGEYLEIESLSLDKIRRVRRITGYLSEIDNFNDSKRAELADRTTHDLDQQVIRDNSN